VQDQEESSTVLTAAQGNRHAVARHDLLLRGNRSGNPLFEICDEMGATQVSVGILLVNYSRFPAEGAALHIRAKGFQAHRFIPRERSV
jgi:hypothetical protein